MTSQLLDTTAALDQLTEAEREALAVIVADLREGVRNFSPYRKREFGELSAYELAYKLGRFLAANGVGDE